MNTLKTLFDQSIDVWKESTGAARAGILLLLFLCVGGVIGVGIWSATPEYVVLSQNIPDKKIHRVIAALDQENIRHQWVGSTIKVAKSQMSDAKMATEAFGLQVEENGPDLKVSDFWATPNTQKELSNYNLKLQIEHSVATLNPVERATVLLTMPPQSSFGRNAQPASASVVIKIAPGATFNSATADAVAAIVARAVPRLEVGNISIADETGKYYKVDQSSRDLDEQEKYRLHREKALAMAAHEMLEPTLGWDNARVKVSATFEFPDIQEVGESFDLEQKVTTMEKIESSDSKSGSPQAQGVTGVASNNESRNNLAGINQNDTKSETIEQETKVPVTTRTQRIQGAKMTALSVSVLINLKALPDQDAKAIEEAKKYYEEMVKTATGFPAVPNASISVNAIEFLELDAEAAVIAEPLPWDQIHLVLKNISLGFAGLVALLIGFMAFRKMAPTGRVPQLASASQGSQVEQLGDLIKKNPEVFNQIIASWSKANTRTSEQQDGDNAVRKKAS